jgi:myo-inositol-1(or 4)-monophosphatase
MNEPLIIAAERAARAAGEVLLQWEGRCHAEEKSPGELVTQADIESQQAIESIILSEYPNHDFLGEEGNATWPRRSDYRWIVDPLDGTTNFVHGLSYYAVSIAVEFRGEVVAGVIFDPKRDECFSTVLRGGARLNGRQVHVSKCPTLKEALVAASFSAQSAGDCLEARQFVELLVGCRGLRRLGSAALNLAYVACGRLDGYWATSLKPWDVAAGALLLREAGGTLTGVHGRPFDLENPSVLAAGQEMLHRELLRALRRPSC